MAIEIDVARALNLLEIVVEKAGEDYVYPGAQYYCSYVEDGKPSCLVGRALHLAGLGVGELADMDDAWPPTIDEVTLPEGVNVTPEARVVLRAAQKEQDWGKTWGEALAVAKELAEE